MNGDVSHCVGDARTAGISFTGSHICKEHTATCTKDVHGGASKTHFPKASGQPNACRNPRGEVGWASPTGGVG